MVIDTGKDYYQILGVGLTASAQDIRLAYRQCAFRCHPDKGGSHQSMVEINEASAILLNSSRRAIYDSLRRGEGGTDAGRWVADEPERPIRNVEAACLAYGQWWRNLDFWFDLVEWTGYAAVMGVVMVFAFLVGLAMVA